MAGKGTGAQQLDDLKKAVGPYRTVKCQMCRRSKKLVRLQVRPLHIIMSNIDLTDEQ
jgi:hypothetical protein